MTNRIVMPLFCKPTAMVLRRTALSLVALTLIIALTGVIEAAGPRACKPGQLPADVRLGPLKDLNGYFPFTVPTSVEAWQTRSTELRRQVLVSQGLWPMPTKQPLKPTIHGRIEQNGYTIEKVFFESMPGFFVTGNLYRPIGRSGKLPGVLCPHGHWEKGRFYDCGLDAVRKQIVQGAERFEDGGRSPMQSRCVQLARMGCVVFHYDMIGYADSQQITREIIHGFAKQRPDMNHAEDWGLFSPRAESRLQSAMGLQTFNSIRALDFLMSLPNIDSERIAVTGASGGGTQTFILSAIDPRVQVAFPAVMVSTTMQGGCTCENACCLRTGTSNVELAALFGPKPLGMSAANDWTVNMPTKGFPELQELFKLLSAPKNVALTALPQFGHNYNYVSRAAMYGWMNEHLHLGLKEPIIEESYPRMNQQQLTVWDNEHPRPAGGPEFERRLLAWWNQDGTKQLDDLLPNDGPSLERYQDVIGQGIAAIIARRLPATKNVKLEVVTQRQRNDYRELVATLTYRLPPRQAIAANQAGKSSGIQEQLPLLLLQPNSPSQHVCVLALPEGKAGLLDDEDKALPPIRRLLDAGVTVCAADLLYQGEFLKDGESHETTRRVENPREAAAYTFGYNPSLFAHRVHDLMSVIALFDQEAYRADRIDLVGIGEAGPWAAVACAQARQRVARLATDDADFRFADIDNLHSPMFLPGAAKYHDLPGILALAAPKPLWLATTADTLPPAIDAAYRASGKRASVTQFAGPDTEKLSAVVQWLLK